ncbi:MAG: DUF58 domain-containing protein [Armatimonadetes bacterium]|nr:DUF58 domain-containing protein [Armatimonadota bacterium]
MLPTRRFWLLLALAIPAAAALGAKGAVLPIVALNGCLFLALGISYWLGPSAAGLRVVRRFDPVLSVRASNRVELHLENRGLEALDGVLRDEPPPEFSASRREFPLHLKPEQSAVFSYHLTPSQRGSDYFRGTFVRIACPLGLAERVVRLRTEQPVRVYPNVLALREFDLLKQRGRLQQMGIRKSRVRGLGMEFESLRDYADGDDYRKIDWKATARRGKLVVRQYETERNQSVILCVDVGRRMLAEAGGATKLDHTLDSLLMLAQAAFSGGDLVGLLVYSDTVKRYIPPRKGRNQLGVIIEAIHDLLAEPIESDHAAAFAYLATRWKRRSLIVSFTDLDDEGNSKDLVKGLGAMPKRHLMLLARVGDPGHRVRLESPIEVEEDLYQKASTALLVEDRKRAGTLLEGAGIHSLEAEPQDLAAALVNFYFAAKELSLV